MKALDHIGAIIALLTFLTASAVGLWRVIRKLVHLVDYLGAEMRPNGGGSMRDAVDRLEASMTAAEESRAELVSSVNSIDGRLARVEAHVLTTPPS